MRDFQTDRSNRRRYVDQLRAIYFDPKAEKDSDLAQRMPRSGCGHAKSLMPKDDSVPRPEAFVAWVSSPGRISRAVEHLSIRHAVRLVWSDGGTEKELVLTVNLCEYASFIANLRRFAGQRLAGGRPRIEVVMINRCRFEDCR